MHSFIVLTIGFVAQGLFAIRVLVQWFLSERSNRVLSPTAFWSFSLAGSALFCVYGWMCDDFTIIFGQIFSYYIYIWNLKMKNAWEVLPQFLRCLLFLTPIAVGCFVMSDAAEHYERFFHNDSIPLWLVLYGLSGQILFVLRFIYQWQYSKKKNESLFPEGFWVISIVASLIVLSYAIMVWNEVLIISQFSIIPYIRNLYIMRKDSARSAQSV